MLNKPSTPYGMSTECGLKIPCTVSWKWRMAHMVSNPFQLRRAAATGDQCSEAWDRQRQRRSCKANFNDGMLSWQTPPTADMRSRWTVDSASPWATNRCLLDSRFSRVYCISNHDFMMYCAACSVHIQLIEQWFSSCFLSSLPDWSMKYAIMVELSKPPLDALALLQWLHFPSNWLIDIDWMFTVVLNVDPSQR